MFYLRKHVIECMQHLHAIGDTTAYALYHLLDLTQQLKPSQVYSHTLLMEKYSSQLGTFKSSLEELINNERFAYVTDFNNQAKHKGLALPQLALSIDEEDPVQRLFFGSITKKYDNFQREGVRHLHPNIPIVQFLSDEIHRITDVHNELAQKIMGYLVQLPSRIPLQ